MSVNVEWRHFVILVCLLLATGCGTTRWTDSARTPTEQLLVSDSIDHAVGQINFAILAGQSVFLDTQNINATVDQQYLISAVKQQLLAGGCLLRKVEAEADFIVELRSGALGTNRSDSLIGVPQITLPGVVPGLPSVIPEIPIIKKTRQTGVAHVAVFAYERVSGTSVWQSGSRIDRSHLERRWYLGMGPYERGTIRVQDPPISGLSRLISIDDSEESQTGAVHAREPSPLEVEMLFREPQSRVWPVPPAPAADEAEPMPPGILPLDPSPLPPQ